MSVTKRWNRLAADLRGWWTRRRRIVLAAAVAAMSAIAALRLEKAFMALLSGRGKGDTTKIFHSLIHRWFASLPVYSESEFAVHLPATYVMLWPFFGWLDITAARWLWLATIVAALGWLAYLIVRESGADTALERSFVALLLLASYGTDFTVRVGQFGLHVLPLLVAGLLLLQRRRPGWSRDLSAGALLLLALVKPPVAAPFMWIALFLPGGWRPLALVSLSYAALTLFAVSYQPVGFLALLREWQARSLALAESAGSINLHIWLAHSGLESWMLPASLLIFVGLGLWIYRCRRADLWLLMAVAAIVARLWTYHRPYDDLLLVIPVIALFRLAKREPSGDGAGIDVASAALLALTGAGMLVPGRWVHAPGHWGLLVNDANALVWIVLLVFLMRQAEREKHSPAGVSG